MKQIIRVASEASVGGIFIMLQKVVTSGVCISGSDIQPVTIELLSFLGKKEEVRLLSFLVKKEEVYVDS